jgi:hypothetical protein
MTPRADLRLAASPGSLADLAARVLRRRAVEAVSERRRPSSARAAAMTVPRPDLRLAESPDAGYADEPEP